MRKFLLSLIMLCTLLAAGCASIVSGQDQVVSVRAPNCEGASCKMTNPSGTYYVKAPGTVTVDKEYDDLVVTCEHEGVSPSTIQVSSTTKGMAFGNILLGGVIGAGVDMATGAAYDYPAEIISPLDCRTASEVAAAPKSGRWDKEALALVDAQTCEAPVFALRDGNSDIYKSRCIDGSVGVIGCEAGKCQPLNVSRLDPDSAQKMKPKYQDQVEAIGTEQQCNESFHATDVTESSEIWMVKCQTGKFLVVKCSSGQCSVST